MQKAAKLWFVFACKAFNSASLTCHTTNFKKNYWFITDLFVWLLIHLFNCFTNVFTYLFFCLFFWGPKTDVEPPVISCPDDIFLSTGKKDNMIFFPGLTTSDNVGVFSIIPSRPNGSEFTWGEHNVTFTVTDKAGNVAECNFKVIITGKYMYIDGRRQMMNIELPSI